MIIYFISPIYASFIEKFEYGPRAIVEATRLIICIRKHSTAFPPSFHFLTYINGNFFNNT